MTAVSLSARCDDLQLEMRWLRRLAADLVGTDGADDLVQQTYVLALSHPPSLDRPVRPWLARVMRNTLLMGRRARVRRERRESLGSDAPPELPSAEALVQRAEAQRFVLEALGDLQDPYRSTLLLLYIEGVSTAELAASEDTAVATIRWRKKKALALLRRELERRHGSRSAWCGLLAPVALVRTRPISALEVGVITMKTSTKIAGALLAITIVGVGVGVGVGRSESVGSSTAEPPAAGAPADEDDTPVEAALPISDEVRAWKAKAASIHRALGRAEPKIDPSLPSPAAGDATPPAQLAARAFQEAYAIIGDCVRDVRGHSGAMTVDLHIVGHPDVGVVVDEVDVTNDSTDDADLVQCVVQSIPAFDFGAVRGSIDDHLVLGVDVQAQQMSSRITETIASWTRRNPGATAADIERMVTKAAENPDAMDVRFVMTLGAQPADDRFRREQPHVGYVVDPPGPDTAQ